MLSQTNCRRLKKCAILCRNAFTQRRWYIRQEVQIVATETQIKRGANNLSANCHVMPCGANTFTRLRASSRVRGLESGSVTKAKETLFFAVAKA